MTAYSCHRMKNNEELRMNNEERGTLPFFCDYSPLLLFNFYLLTIYLFLSKEARYLYNSFEKMCCNECYSFEKVYRMLVYSLEKV